VLGPVSGVLMLYLRQHSAAWPVRFHAYHSILMSGVWAMAWGALRLVQEISPWFLATIAQEARFALNFCAVLAWACLLFTAYRDWRCATIPYVHRMAVKLARRYEKRSIARAEAF
jgi:uncharacterized membrane protein